MKRRNSLVILLFSIIVLCVSSCIPSRPVIEEDMQDKFKLQYYEEYFNAVEVLLDTLYELDNRHDILWHDTVMETAEYEQYETIRDLINGNINN